MSKRLIIMLLACVSLSLVVADDYVDDLYFTSEIEVDKAIVTQPHYNPNVKEIVFVLDSLETETIPPQDTVLVW